jgi:hypothetical protein
MKLLLGCFTLLAACTLPAEAQAAASSAEIDALTLTNDVLMYVGEEYGNESALRERLRLSDVSNPASAALISELSRALDLGAHEGDVPWETARPISAGIRDVVVGAEKAQVDQVRLINELLLSEYLYLAFYSGFEVAPEHPDSIISKRYDQLFATLKDKLGESVTASQLVAVRCMQDAIGAADNGAAGTRITPLVFYKCSRRLSTKL